MFSNRDLGKFQMSLELFCFLDRQKGGFCKINYSKYGEITFFPDFNLKDMATKRIFPVHGSSQQ